MKIFTHKFVIYDNSWRFEWEEKPPIDPINMARDILIMVWVGLCFSPNFL